MSRPQPDGLLIGIAVDFGLFPAEAALRLYTYSIIDVLPCDGDQHA